MCICNREPLNTDSKQKKDQKRLRCWLCAVQPVSSSCEVNIKQIFPLITGRAGGVSEYVWDLALSFRSELFGPLAEILQTSHPNKRGLYTKSFMDSALQKLVGMPAHLSVQDGVFRIGSFCVSTELQSVQDDYFQLCKQQFRVVMGINITDKPAVELVLSQTLLKVALSSFLGPQLLMKALKFQQELDMAPIPGVPPLSLVLRRLIDTRDTARFVQLLDSAKHSIVHTNIHEDSLYAGEDYVGQCMELWIGRTDKVDSDVRRLYYQVFGKEMPRPVVDDYEDMADVNAAISEKISPLVQRVQITLANVRAGVFVEMAKMAGRPGEPFAESKAAWVLEHVTARAVVCNILRVFKPHQWYVCV
jgi:hypothetical protein